jgi:hypothetical protein
LGNGYFVTWCADVVRRQLAQAVEDSRYALGETILTFWPWPNQNFRGLNGATRVIAVDEDGDGRKDRSETVAMSIMKFLEQLTRMGDTFWVLPERTCGAHVVSGFGSMQENAVYILLYTHHARDIQSRANATFDINLELDGIDWPAVRVQEYRFDKENNSYFRLGVRLRDRQPGGPHVRRLTQAEVDKLAADLRADDRATQLAALKELASVAPLPDEIIASAFQLYERTDDAIVRAAIEQVGQQIQNRQVCYSADEVAQVRELSLLRVTRQSSQLADTDGTLRLPVTVAANGANFVVIKSAGPR